MLDINKRTKQKGRCCRNEISKKCDRLNLVGPQKKLRYLGGAGIFNISRKKMVYTGM